MLDSKSLDRLWSGHSQAIFGYLFSLTKQQQSAEELLQETFLKAMKSFPLTISCQDVDSARGWLIRVARNLFIDRYRKQLRESGRVEFSGETFESIDVVLDALVVKEALLRLSNEHQEVIKHCILRQLTVAETAQLIGVPAGTVKSRTYYALKAMRLQLQEMGFAQWMTTNE